MFWPIGAPRIYAASASSVADVQDAIIEDSESNEEREHRKRHVLGSGSESDSTEFADAKDTLAGSDAIDGTDEATVQDQKTTVEDEKDGNPADRDLGRIRPQVSSGVGPQVPNEGHRDGAIVGLRVSRSGHIFAAITRQSLTIWQTRPTAILASVIRSPRSLKSYGHNVELLLRPDSAVVGIQTSSGHIFTYSIAADPDARVYKQKLVDSTNGHGRRQSISGSRGFGRGDRPPDEGGIREISLQFRSKIHAGTGKTLTLDDEIIVATDDPAEVRCYRWVSEKNPQIEQLSDMTWISDGAKVIDMVHDRPMKLHTWVISDGKAYAVQRLPPAKDPQVSDKLFQGYCFHSPGPDDRHAVKAAINARFSLLAVGCADGTIQVYTARDYHGNIPLSHSVRPGVSSLTSGRITYLSFSPDGYGLFAGYERGWMMWSAFGKAGAHSFNSDARLTEGNDEGWLRGVHGGGWFAGGSELLLIGKEDERLWVLEMARSALTGCFASANIARSLLQTSSGFMINKGYELSDLTTIPADASLWQPVQVPAGYLGNQWPLKTVVISPDGRYVAVAGRRGLAHYSVNSGRWKTFANESAESGFSIRGGMCWHQHILIAAVEYGAQYELRLYSREQPLDNDLCHHIETLSSPVVHLTTSGEDSLLVYTYENILYHYVITAANETVKLVLVGHIAFHGIIRSPSRVRAISWILPDEQLRDGDPSRDVAVASVFFLVDGKMVLLQPSTTDEGELKYDMRVVAQNVEYYLLMREQASWNPPGEDSDDHPGLTLNGIITDGTARHGLQDSLWVYDGQQMRVWADVQEVLRSASSDVAHDLPPSVHINVDFYPLAPLLSKGIILGGEVDLVQRRDVSFSFFRLAIRTHLFLPQILRHHLAQYNSPAALHLSHHYRRLPYFPHALEVLLHDVLDEEVDRAPSPELALLPSILSFLSTFPEYLDILVQCTRKTEVRSWRTLFAYLPPPQELFEESLQKGLLKTAGGYLLVLHTFQELSTSSQQLVRLLSRAKEEQDWELCKELARFLMALDESGATLREALEMVDLKNPRPGSRGKGSFMFESARPSSSSSSSGTRWANGISGADVRENGGGNIRSARSGPTVETGIGISGLEDYFSNANIDR